MFSKEARLKEVMHENPHCIYTSDSLSYIQDIFKENDFHHLPVVDEEGDIIGIVSIEDFEYAMAKLVQDTKGKLNFKESLSKMKAEQIMTRNPTVLRTEDPVSLAVKYFLKNEFHSLPILDTKNKLVGIVTSHDLLKFAFR